jgi:hypothetical protein
VRTAPQALLFGAALVIGCLGRPAVASADVGLVEQSGSGTSGPTTRLSASPGALVSDTPTVVVRSGDSIQDVVTARQRTEELLNKQRQAQENVRQVALNGGTPEQLEAAREQLRQAQAAVVASRDGILSSLEANERVTQAAVTREEQRIYGPDGPTTLQRAGNAGTGTAGVLAGTAEGTVTGLYKMGAGLVTMAAHPVDTFHAVVSAFSGPAPTQAERAAADAAQLEQERAERVAQVGAPFQTGREGGQILGEAVLAPLAGGEIVGLAVKGGVGLVTSRMAAREAETAAALAKEQQLTAARVAAVAKATDGLPKLEGTVSGEALGQGSQYVPFRLADGTEALAFRGQPYELRDARAAIDVMNKAQPGVMPKVYGQTVLPNGDTALVVERYQGGQVLMQVHDPAVVNQALGRVLTPEGMRAMNAWELGRGFDRDYAFLMPDGSVRLSVPRRADQFRDLVDTGRIFQNTTPRVGPK